MDSMTRAMFFTVLHRMSGEDTGEAGETWYSGAMEWAMALGITDGTAPEADITREQLAVMLYRYAGAEDPGRPERLHRRRQHLRLGSGGHALGGGRGRHHSGSLVECWTPPAPPPARRWPPCWSG